jgi:hypothetical protein
VEGGEGHLPGLASSHLSLFLIVSLTILFLLGFLSSDSLFTIFVPFFAFMVVTYCYKQCPLLFWLGFTSVVHLFPPIRFFFLGTWFSYSAHSLSFYGLSDGQADSAQHCFVSSLFWQMTTVVVLFEVTMGHSFFYVPFVPVGSFTLP